MNKDSVGLSDHERFNLYLSAPAIDRELAKIKRPIVNVEPLPQAQPRLSTTPKKKDPKKSPGHLLNKRLDKKASKMQPPKLAEVEDIPSEDTLPNEQVSEILRCLICFNIPVYPKECGECSKIVCDTCLIKYEKTKGRHMPVCMHCKTENISAFRDVNSKVLLDLIDLVKVGHRCTKNGAVEPITVHALKRHVESGECGCYSLRCFCGHLDKFSLEGLKKHMREDCEMVRLQCKYCHKDHNYPSGVLD